jgi:hypothetical protein
MSAQAPSLGRFILATFAWLPPSFAAWYLTSPFHAALASAPARLLVSLLDGTLVSAVERQGSMLVFVTRLQVPADAGQIALVTPEVNALLYTYGIALFLALMLASRARWWKLLLGAVLLVPFQGWGIAFDFLAQVGVRLGPDVALQAGLVGWRRELIAFGYQLGSLVLPGIMPVIVWASLNRPFIASLPGSERYRTARAMDHA